MAAKFVAAIDHGTTSATPRTLGRTTRGPDAGWVSDWSVRRRDCYPEEAEPPRTLCPEDAWLLSAVSSVMVSSG